MEKDLKTLNQQEKEQLWAERVLDYRESGQTVTKWCKGNNIKVSTFYTWQRKLFQEDKNELKFTEILVTETQELTPPTAASKIIATLLINGVKVEIYAGSSPQDIQNLIRWLKLC